MEFISFWNCRTMIKNPKIKAEAELVYRLLLMQEETEFMQIVRMLECTQSHARHLIQEMTYEYLIYDTGPGRYAVLNLEE